MSRTKTEYLDFKNDVEETMELQGVKIALVDEFGYLGSTIE